MVQSAPVKVADVSSCMHRSFVDMCIELAEQPALWLELVLKFAISRLSSKFSP